MHIDMHIKKIKDDMHIKKIKDDINASLNDKINKDNKIKKDKKD